MCSRIVSIDGLRDSAASAIPESGSTATRVGIAVADFAERAKRSRGATLGAPAALSGGRRRCRGISSRGGGRTRLTAPNGEKTGGQGRRRSSQIQETVLRHFPSSFQDSGRTDRETLRCGSAHTSSES
jgi:hypothetical protein